MKKLFIPFAVAAALSSCCNGTCSKDNASDTKSCCDSAKTCCDSAKVVCGGCIKGEWNIVSANGVSTDSAATKAFIAFGDSSKINGNGGVNSFFGEYAKSGDTLSFKNVGQTKMMGPHMEIDDAVIDAINKTASVKVCGDSATVMNAEGKAIMVLVKNK